MTFITAGLTGEFRRSHPGHLLMHHRNVQKRSHILANSRHHARKAAVVVPIEACNDEMDKPKMRAKNEEVIMVPTSF
jgi:mRNA-degrading endonuclease toxin of MazEF toxin-antitoxin module